jgi:hypothetical protein
VNDNDIKSADLVAGLTSGAQEHLHIDASAIQQIGALALAATAVQEINGTAHLVLPNDHKHIDLTGLIEKAGAAPRRAARPAP